MAEIRIEKKDRNWLPIILGILALLVVGWLIWDAVDKDPEIEVGEIERTKVIPETRPEVEIPESIEPINLENFDATWDGSNADFNTNKIYYLSSLEHVDAEMNLNHDYSNIALKALANSLSALAIEYQLSDDLNIKTKVDQIRDHANAITQNWKSGDHADKIRKAALIAADLMITIQEKKFPKLEDEVARVKMEAMAIKADTLTLEQKENIKSFFQSAADVLEAIRNV